MITLFTICIACGEANPDEKNNNTAFDASPLYVEFVLKDEKGNNLLEETTTGNWLDDEIVCSFEGKQYSYPDTKYYPAEMNGLTLVPAEEEVPGYVEGHEALLHFGDLNGQTNRSSNLLIVWPDGSRNTVLLSNRFSVTNGKPMIQREWRLDNHKASQRILLEKKPR